ncbi:conjugal transfer pilus assembly protein TraE [Vibrio crassostreae]|uniref:type IV conjugative transfer system protein TraE n=2 Tax=Vibrio crassostreae TaxID=246167 RepID=UPI0010623D9D|nr:type IV conjugative transfer system protein TraE [Vibrio crassostreae]CAH6780684.1 Conjugal transfer pilus assembly protein TraE [Vibrio chagasii]TDW04571.1 conjugal transfer pilus assembly protein TraE [Vibrio crassostreae]CAH6802752.1 Conjugal transfer pilus assembly protein TraE [Vibrio chagasii]CAH6815765.1 Conjugal transfer pilus assembly protein TraE [Vibrio chagasii]CAH6815920.1 Conjugal transfer pilus assembly protein TraE [Vibrio chagasii]
MLNEHNGEALKAARFINYVLTAVVLITALGVAGLSFALLSQSQAEKRTVVPPHIDRAFTISNEAVDEAYLSMMADWWIHLKFNVTPSNVKRQFNLLITYVPPKYWSGLQDKLIREAEFIIENDVTSFFEVDTLSINLNEMKIRVKGTLNKTIAGRALDPEPVTYLLQADYSSGLIELHSIVQETPL